MEALMEILLDIIFEPLMRLIFGVPIEQMLGSRSKSRLPKWLRIALGVPALLIVMVAPILLIAGIIILTMSKVESDFPIGVILLSVGGGVLIVYAIVVIIRLRLPESRRYRMKKYRRLYKVKPTLTEKRILGKSVRVIVDRPLGSVHPEHADIIYGVNYGFISGVKGGDGEAQDAYVLGVDEPVREFSGVVAAIIRRENDCETKWVVVPEGYEPTDKEIVERTEFMEKHFKIKLVRR